ncbi:protein DETOXIFICATION 31-like [Diospyros lotus]|uniref:protein DETOXIFICATION 31-like n=1 Tax=Diospyros lotus TaxID=55363 RepID=UPI00225358E2|nr:protein DETOXIFICATION 31-like [Diospyros lotus]
MARGIDSGRSVQDWSSRGSGLRRQAVQTNQIKGPSINVEDVAGSFAVEYGSGMDGNEITAIKNTCLPYLLVWDGDELSKEVKDTVNSSFRLKFQLLTMSSWVWLIMFFNGRPKLIGQLYGEVVVWGLDPININILVWAMMVAIGCNAAISVRVSNELGAGHPRTAKFSVVVVVVVLSSMVIGIVISLILIIFRKQYLALFADSAEVKELVYELAPTLAGIWYGMMSGTLAQTCVLYWIIPRTNWNKEASIAGNRIKQWGGEPEATENDVPRSI